MKSISRPTRTAHGAGPARRALVLTAAGALLALTAACGSAADTSTTSSAGAAGASFPATVQTKFGDVTVEAQPTRVVALGWGDAETALALGVQPVGASDWLAFGGDGVGPWAEGLYEQSPTLIGTMEPDYEAIAALAPDLILDVRSSGDQDRYDKLSAIATTVGVPEGGDQYLTSWQDQTTMIATALGVPDAGDRLVADTEADIAAAAADNPDFAGLTVSVAALSSAGWGAYVTGDARVDLLTGLGFTQNPDVDAAAEDGQFYVTVSEEKLDLLDADLVVAIPIYVEASAITDDELFEAVPAVADGRVVVIDDTDVANAFSAGTALSIGYALDAVTPLLTGALGG